jgi:hypothetical protein
MTVRGRQHHSTEVKATKRDDIDCSMRPDKIVVMEGKGLLIDCTDADGSSRAPPIRISYSRREFLVLAEPGLVSLVEVNRGCAQISQVQLTRTRRPIMYMLAPKLLNIMTLNPGTIHFPRA